MALKYGKADQKETALLTLMTTDISVIAHIKTGAFLFKQIWKYCAKVKGVFVLNQYFESNFALNAKKVSSYFTLSAYLNSLSSLKQGELLLANRQQLELDNAKLAELIEHYQKCKKGQFELSMFHYSFLVNFEYNN